MYIYDLLQRNGTEKKENKRKKKRKTQKGKNENKKAVVSTRAH